VRFCCVAVLFGAALSLSACVAPAPKTTTYLPGLGDIMTAVAARHAKLWFAGSAGNWPLAAYEVDELKEGLEDAGTLHPTHRKVPGPVAPMIARTMDPPLRQVEVAVASRNPRAFANAYDAVTEGCNDCHQASGFGFNKVVRPTANPFSNQGFEP
jgi:hypothetical protein